MPKGLKLLDNKKFEENSFQNKKKTGSKLEQQKLRAAKNEELVLRERNDGTQWQKNFAETEQAIFQTNAEGEIAQHIAKHFEDMTGESAANCLVSKLNERWAQIAQRF